MTDDKDTAKERTIEDLEVWIEGRVRTLTSKRDRMLRLFLEDDLDDYLDKLIAANSKRRGYLEVLEYIKIHRALSV